MIINPAFGQRTVIHQFNHLEIKWPQKVRPWHEYTTRFTSATLMGSCVTQLLNRMFRGDFHSCNVPRLNCIHYIGLYSYNQRIQYWGRTIYKESTSALSLSGACQEDVAASTSVRHAGLSQARRLADARPKLSGRRSSSTVLSQVCLGLPVLRRQSLGGPRMQA